MYKEPNRQCSFFGSMIYERIIPESHFLKQLSNAVDFSFINGLCGDLYCQDNGRAGWEPALMFKVVFLQFLYDISDRQVEEQLRYNLVFKWFIGIEADELPPDYSCLSKFRSRLGTERFKNIFNTIVGLAQDKGFISERLTIVDSSHIEAKVDLFRLSKEYKESEEDKSYIDRNSPDPDARIGHKSKKKSFYGYKAHTGLDSDSEIITTCEVTSGNEADGDKLPALIRGHPREVTADKAYDSNDNHEYLKREHIRSSIIIKKNRTNEEVIGLADPQSQRERPKIEHKFAELKNYHGLKRSRYWGLERVTIQCLISCIVVNCKRLVKLALGILNPKAIVFPEEVLVKPAVA